jgi:hypothetical protein
MLKTAGLQIRQDGRKPDCKSGRTDRTESIKKLPFIDKIQPFIKIFTNKSIFSLILQAKLITAQRQCGKLTKVITKIINYEYESEIYLFSDCFFPLFRAEQRANMEFKRYHDSDA